MVTFNYLYALWERIVPINIREKLNLREKLNISDISFQNKLCDLKRMYGDSKDEEIIELIKCVENEGKIKAINYFFTNEYEKYEIEEYFDESKQLPYVLYCGYKMYLKERMRGRCVEYVRTLFMEQDERSPHKYLHGIFDVCEDDIVFDVGAAEGIFALSVVDRVKSVTLFECDDEWIRALRCTFESFGDKVNIVKGFVGEKRGNGLVSLGEYVLETNIHPTFVKLDIEGSEVDALKGLLKYYNDVKMISVCTYHTQDAEAEIRALLADKWNIEVSEKYMIWGTEWKKPYLRRGIIRAVLK